MITFFNVVYTTIGIKDKIYPCEPFKEDYNYNFSTKINEDALLKTLIYQIYFDFNTKNKGQTFSFSKFSSLNCFLNNDFCKKELKEKLLNKFCKIQKTYYGFIKLANLYRHKYYKTVVNNDLSLNLLDKNNKNVIALINNNSKYLFSLNDIIQIVETSISNSPDFFTDPLWPVNPYCRQPFLISDLYNTYFILKKSSRNMSILFHCFFLSNFNLKLFETEYESLIREFSIKKYVYCSPYTILYDSVLKML